MRVKVSNVILFVVIMYITCIINSLLKLGVLS